MARGEPWLLLAGGDADPNMLSLLRAAAARGLRVSSVLVGKAGVPRCHLDYDNCALHIDGHVVRPSAAFIRQDVFDWESRADAGVQAAVWHDVLFGWLAIHPEIRWMNRDFLLGSSPNKLRNLEWARQCGFCIPKTLISNDAHAINEAIAGGNWVHKPVRGGAHCQALEAIATRTGRLSYPITAQEKLSNPEFRLFKIGDQTLAFEINSDHLDHRADKKSKIQTVETDPSLSQSLHQLAARLGLDYAAIDLKTHPNDGRPVFLEINSNPMFSGFDQFANGQLTELILDWLQMPPQSQTIA